MASAYMCLRYRHVRFQGRTDLELVLEQILLVRQLTIETEEFLFLLIQGLVPEVIRDVHFQKKKCQWLFDNAGLTLTSTLFFWCGFMLKVVEVGKDVKGWVLILSARRYVRLRELWV